MRVAPDPLSFAALDACHQEILVQLEALTTMAQAFETQGASASVRQQARDIESFFSTTSRAHHAQEEAEVFPSILAGDNAELKAVVRSLQQDHGWIEENWIELSPKLSALAQGSSWFDPNELQHDVEVFQALLRHHIALEESTVYPVCKAHWALKPTNAQAVPLR